MICRGQLLPTGKVLPAQQFGFNATMGALGLLRADGRVACSAWHPPLAICRTGLSTSRTSPSGLSVSNHPSAPPDRFGTCPVSVGGKAGQGSGGEAVGIARRGFPLVAGLGFATPPEARQSARPYRVRHPTDCPFAFRCFPPHLAVTQLRSATGRKQVFLKGTFISLMLHACGRTSTPGYDDEGPAETRRT
jgi:hypothetical protein